MAAERLQIIIDATFQGKAGLEAAGRQLKQLDDEARKASEGTRYLKEQIGKAVAGIGAGIAAATLTLKKFYDLLQEGAALERSAAMFDNLAASIGSTSDAMLVRLREATNGMVSDAQLIASAGQIINLGLADTEDGVVRLATLVSKLGWDMQQVIMTFANNSVMRLDALGLSVEDVTSKAKALEAQGYSTDKAFDMAVIQAGEEKLALLGDSANSLSGDLQMLTADFENLKNAALETWAAMIGPSMAAMSGRYASTVDEIITGNLAAADSMDELIAQGQRTAAQLNRAFGLGAVFTGTESALHQGIQDNILAMARMATSAEDLGDAVYQAFTGRARNAALGMIRDMGGLDAIMSATASAGLRDFTDGLEELAAAGRTATAPIAAASQNVMLFAEGIGVSSEALIRHEKYLAAVAAGYTTAAGAIDAMRAAQQAAQEAQRQALGGEFTGAFDTTGMSEASRIMLETAANAGTAAEQLYVLAGGGQAAGEAMMQAAVNVRAAQLGELLAAGLITAKQAAQDLQDFADNLNLEDMFSADKILPGTTSPESLRDQLLGPAEGLVSAVSDTVTAATEPATNAIDELIKSLDEADQMDPEIVVDDETVTSATGNVNGLYEALVSLTDRDWTVNVVYQTSGTIPGATDGATGGGTAPPPPSPPPAPGGNAPSRGGRAPATNTTYNFNMPGMSPAGVESRVNNAMTRGYARSTR